MEQRLLTALEARRSLRHAARNTSETHFPAGSRGTDKSIQRNVARSLRTRPQPPRPEAGQELI